MKILVSGSTGLVGSALMESLARQGHEAVRLTRPSAANDGGAAHSNPASVSQFRSALWSYKDGILDSGAEGADVVVHLAGASIAGGRWTSARKRELRDSRIAATRHLVGSLGKLHRPPHVFIAASAVGFYGSRGDEELTESSPPGADFLADLTVNWEAESARARDFGARVVMLRFGIILARNGGALPRMALPFRLGIGGRLGDGLQWMSWVTLEDVLGIIRYAMETSLLSGPVNVVSPHPIRNKDFSAILARVLHRPALLPTPPFALRLALGEMADALLLASQRALPHTLERMSHTLAHSDLESALLSIFGRSR